ncbi:MAG: hypothetical protein HQL50_04030 [Magnetococcales bacterium]|nr:hypothetical protein [Magnetococcales bacterium]
MTCQGSFRLSPSGHVIGIGMETALAVAEHRGYDVALILELLQAAGVGVVEAMQIKE